MDAVGHDGINYQRLYEYRHRGVDQGARNQVWGEIAPWIWERMGRPERVLDPAAGRCEFINAVPATERWIVDTVDYAEAWRAPGVKMIIADIVDAELPDGYFDGIFVSNFLEHLPTQEAVARVLSRLFECCAPGGTVCVMGPNFRHTAKTYFDCADHTLALTHVAVAEHIFAAGFEVAQVHPQFLPFSYRGLLPPSAALTRRYLRTPLAWRLLGKQFLVFGVKPA